MKCAELLRIDQWTDGRAAFSAWYLPPSFLSSKRLWKKSVSDVNCSFVFDSLHPFVICSLMLRRRVQGSSQVSSASLPLWVVWAQSRRKGVRHIGVEHQGSSLFMGLTRWPRSFPVGKVYPSSSGCKTFPRNLPVSYAACHTVNLVRQSIQPKDPSTDAAPKKPSWWTFIFPSLESRGNLWFYLHLIIDVQLFSANQESLCRATLFPKNEKVQ